MFQPIINPMAASTQHGSKPADPEIAAIREHLEQVLSSPEVANAERLPRLLRFVVEAALTGNTEQLKEHVIGLQGFDRAGEYDPRIDSTERQGGIRIEVPRGGYAAVFVFASGAERQAARQTARWWLGGQRRPRFWEWARVRA